MDFSNYPLDEQTCFFKIGSTGVNFINISRVCFLYERCFYFLATFWLCQKKNVRKILTLVKLTAGINFINILRVCFLYKSVFLPKRNQKKAAEKTFIQKKSCKKMLMQLTPGFTKDKITFKSDCFFPDTQRPTSYDVKKIHYLEQNQNLSYFGPNTNTQYFCTQY